MPVRLKISVQVLARITLVLALFCALVIGVSGGIILAQTSNEVNRENFSDFTPALPTKLLDIKGRLITEFSSDEKREMIAIEELPRHVVYALIAREDQDFFKHRGFSLRGFTRALIGVLLRRNLGGGSTITQQLAGTLKADRDDNTLRRKLVELWWAFQFERRFTKNEILELYMNKMYFGDGYYGVESAAKYFFGRSAREISPAEAAILFLQLSSVKGRYNPFKSPANAQKRSREVLETMVKAGYCDKREALESYAEYWENFDYTRAPVPAFMSREDKARYFSEYVRRQLDDLLYGSIDYYKDGLTINTTLNLDHQAAADSYMARGIEDANREYKASSGVRNREAEATVVPMINALTLLFDLEDLRSAEARAKAQINSRYQNQINQVVDASALLFGLPGLKDLSKRSYENSKVNAQKTTVEGALISIDNDTGYVLSLVGGSGFSSSNTTIRAVQSTLQPGSCFKPLYYSAAIDSRQFTMGSLIYDAPVNFTNPDGTPYIPLNYKGEWKGPVLLWYALAKSMNVPSLKILDGIGFDAAINRAAALLGIREPRQIAATFPRVYPLGLGVIETNPMQMAKAFSSFANGGKEVTPISIRSVEDRNGGIILDVEKELRNEQKRKGQGIQVVSPQNAYIMTELLQGVLRSGTLEWETNQGTRFSYKNPDGKKYTIPAAGKTGTTQNWADAWTVGYTPYMTTAIWFGFDLPGNSLGTTQSGAVIAGKAWGSYMYDVHRGMPERGFARPQTGLVDVQVCAKSGQLPTESCSDGTIRLTFLEGTQPRELCSLHAFSSERDQKGLDTISDTASLIDQSRLFQGGQNGGLKLDESLFGSPSTSSAPSILD